LQFARANATTKNCKRVCLANAQEEMKIAANLKGKNDGNERMPAGNNVYKALGSKWLN